MSLADKNACELVTLSQIVFDALARSSTFISRRARSAVVRSLFIGLITDVSVKRRLPPVPSQTFALEPELKVGSTVVAKG